jgi:hypothetical protein
MVHESSIKSKMLHWSSGGFAMDQSVANELCNFLDELALFAADTYRKADALRRMTEQRHFTTEAFRQAEGRTDANARLEALTASVARLREVLHLSQRDPPTLPTKPDPIDLSFLQNED